MGKFGKKICQKRAAANSVDNTVYVRAHKKAAAIDKETTDRLAALSDYLDKGMAWSTMVHLQFILYHEFGIGAMRFCRINDRIKLYNDCINDKLVSLKELVDIQIRSNEREDGPHGRFIGMGWESYKEHKTVEEIASAGDIAKTSLKAIKENMMQHKKRSLCESIYQTLEVLIITALQDELDWGKGRISKVVDILRRARKEWSIERFEHILNVLMKRGVMDDNARDKKDLMETRLRVEGLM